MAGTVLVLDPRAERFDAEAKERLRVEGGLAGKTVAILDNRWQSMTEIARALDRVLRDEHGAGEILHYQTHISKPADPAVIDEVKRLANMGVIGLGN